MKLKVEISEPKLIGYFARPTMKWKDWPNAPIVEEICTASDCMSGCDWDWINEWRHNEMWVYDSPELAWGVVPEPQRPQCDLYAYRMYPLRFVLGQQVPCTIQEVNPMPMNKSFTKLGYDLVSRSQGNRFEHSPLSCNGLADEVPTNRYCLLDQAEDAFAIAQTLEVPGKPERGEPGPYHIVEVWRQRQSSTQILP